MRILTLALALPVLSAVACGRSSPDGAGLSTAAVDTIARDACFDTPEELHAQLDASYLASTTPLLNQSQVEGFARGVCFDTVDELTTQLDSKYAPFGTSNLNQGDVETFAKGVCFDTAAELHTALDADLDAAYLPVGFKPDFATGLTGVPAGFADGVDNDTAPTATAPLQVVANVVSINPAGCVANDVLGFQAGAFSCAEASVQPVGTLGVSSPVANAATKNEAVPVIIKIEVTVAIAAAAGTQEVLIYQTGQRAPRQLLVADVWAVGSAVTGTPTWELRDQTNALTTSVAVPAANAIDHAAAFVTAAARQVNITDDLKVRVTATGAAESATFTVFVLGVPF